MTAPPPFFVVGTGRSGTTLFRKLLAAHPDVHMHRETHWLPLLHSAYGLRRAPAGDLLAMVGKTYMAKGKTAIARIAKDEGLSAEELLALVAKRLPGDGLATVRDVHEALWAALGQRRGRARCGDKTPDYGLCMGTIAAYWPAARFVHVLRDGRDVALSMSEVLSFRILAASGLNHWWPLAWERGYERHLEGAAGEIPLERFYRLWLERLLRIRDEAERLPAGACLEVEYERLLAEPVEVLKKTATHLELANSAAWIAAAVPLIRPSNRDKNRDRLEHRELSERHGPELDALGFRS